MNKKNAHLFLPLVQALTDGKTIQHAGANWEDIEELEFSEYDKPKDFRIKPEEPRTFTILRNKYSGAVERDQKLERERDDLIVSLNFHAELNKELIRQRDRLAEALERLERTAGSPALHDDPARVQARQVLQSLTIKHND